MRLTDRFGIENNQSGRLEVLVDGDWSTICDDTGDDNQWTPSIHVNENLSKVVCSMYGYDGVGLVINEWGKRTGQTDGQMKWSKLTCRGDEISVFDCDHSMDLTKPWAGSGVCTAAETVGIYCF